MINAQDAAATPATHDELHRWQVNTGVTDAQGNFTFGVGGDIAWDADKMFSAAKLIVEMEYQHAAIDQYARTVTPHILEVVGYSSGIDPTVSLEYSQAAFRFGHSTLRETIDTIDPAHGLTGRIMSYALEQAFLNPALFAQEGPASIALGMSHQQMNEIDEFVTPALNQGLLGQPLDLAAINIARGRDIGIPTLNEFRGKVGLTEYVSWDDFGHNMIHPELLANFIAAYAFDGDLAKAQAIVGLADGSIVEGSADALGYTADQALAFMFNDAGAPAGADAFNKIDTWIGGLAEAHVPGGLLGSTFDLVFVNQMENLINGDRFYYLVRLFGQQFGEEVNNGQFKDIVERNTGLTHLNGSIFAYADQYYEFGADANLSTVSIENDFLNYKYGALLNQYGTLGIWSDGSANPSSVNGNGALITTGGIQYIRDFRPDLAPDAVHPVEGTPTSGADSHEVMVGTANRDYLHMRGGDDTAYGEAGDDKIFGDFGNDRLYGGDGNDMIDSGDGADLVDGGAGDDLIYGFGSGTEIGGFDQLIGGSGNDTIYGGEGVDKLSGGAGDDALYGEGNTDPFTHGGDGNDYIDGGTSGDNLYGDNGDDFVYGGDDQDIVQGDSGDDILRPGRPSQAINGGPDEVIGGTGYVDDGFDLMDLSDYDVAPTGVTADMTTQQNPLTAIDGTTPFPAWFQMEGVIGTQNNDVIIGDDPVTDPSAPINDVYGNNWLIGGSGNDRFTGAGGDDVIIGGSIRLDALIGTYNNPDGAPGGAYDHVLADGATHRAAANAVLSGGLLATAGMGQQAHFTEMLRSERFKDLVLGDGGADGVADTATFTGVFTDYVINGVDATTVRLVDNRGIDSSALGDLVRDVELFEFANGTRTFAQLFTQPPTDIQWNGVTPGNGTPLTGNLANGLPGAGTVIANLSSTDADTNTGFVYALAGGSSAGFAVSAPGVVTRTGTAMAANATYTLNISSTDTTGATRIETFSIRTGTNSVLFGTNGVNTITADASDNIIYGSGGNDILNGAGGADNLFGQADNDNLSGQAGADILVGGAGVDTIDGGAGNDIVKHTVGDGGGAVNGGVDNDVLEITGTAAGNTLVVVSNAGTLTNFDGGAVVNVELITADLGAGADTLSYAGNLAVNSVSVNLATGAAAGFASIANIENVTGGAGNDALIGNANANVLTGGGGNDTLDGSGGNDTLIGSGGTDIAILSGQATDHSYSLVGANVVVSSVPDGSDTLTNIEQVSFGGSTFTLVPGNNGSNNSLNVTAGADLVLGFDGNDVLDGGAGVDVLVGGAGADRFAFTAANTANNDSIADFQAFSAVGAAHDTIDVSGIDANGNLAGNGAFTYGGETALFSSRGQLIYYLDGGSGHYLLAGNTDANNATAEFQIDLGATHKTLAPVDFIH